MDFIQCQKHDGSKLNMIYLENDKTQLICELCLDDYIIKEESLKSYQILSIQRIINQPNYLIQKLKINQDLLKHCEDLVKNNQNSVAEKISDLEKQLKLIQDKLMQMFQEFKNCIQKISELKQTLIGDISKILDYDQLKKLLLGLTQQKDNINPDAIEQIQQQLNHYFKALLHDNSSQFQKDLYIKSTEIQEAIELDISKLEKQDNLSQLLKQFYEDQLKLTVYIFPKLQINLLTNSNLITNIFRTKLQNTIESRTKKKMILCNLIYLGTRDGLTKQQFWQKVNGKANLLMIFKSNSNYIFGGYSPCQWQMNLSSYVQDNSLSSFLFSQTHDEIYPLKEVQKQNAIFCNSSYGPCFGGGHDFGVYFNFQTGVSNLGHSYQLGNYLFQHSTHLFGEQNLNIMECEIYEIIFI